MCGNFNSEDLDGRFLSFALLYFLQDVVHARMRSACITVRVVTSCYVARASPDDATLRRLRFNCGRSHSCKIMLVFHENKSV